jgi:type IV pilus assembly protein PilF
MTLFQRRWLLPTMALVMVLAGCATQPGVDSRTDGNGEVQSYAPNRSESVTADLVTESDEGDLAKRSRLRLELASAYFAQGQTATALDEVKRALQANPNNGLAYNLRGLIYASLGEQVLAEESFRRSLQLSSNDADAMHNYGWYLCGLRRYTEAQAQFTRALTVPQYREQSKTWLAQGICEARAGDLVTAEKSLLHSYELDASNPATAFNLAEVLLRAGNLERARFYVQRINAVPDYTNADSLWLAARIEYRRGNIAAADELGAQLRTRYPNSRQANAYDQRQFDE